MAIPEIYAQAPAKFQRTLQNSHPEFEKGWPGITLEGFLGVFDKDGHLAVIKAVFDRVERALPAIWSYLDVLLRPWTYGAGAQVSQGFKFRCSKPDEMLKLMRGACQPPGKKFCEDSVNCHGPKDCFRELITTGPGLHVCITQPAHRGSDDELYDLHIDQFQMVCTAEQDGKCNYQHLSGNSVDHYKHAIPWWLRENIAKPLIAGIAKGGEPLDKNGNPYPFPKGPKY